MKISLNIVYTNHVVCFRNYDEHHQLPAGKVPVLIYDDEPSSIIAYTLGWGKLLMHLKYLPNWIGEILCWFGCCRSQEYFAKLQEIQASITQRDSTQNK